MSEYQPIPFELPKYELDESIERSQRFYQQVKNRRTVRDFTDQPIDQQIIENAIKAAGTAPNGANMQPWHFVAISDPIVKRQIRIGAEEEEREFYKQRASEEWLDALEHLGTDDQKPFLETASHLIVVFLKKFSLDENGEKKKNYYTSESVGIASGFLINALHHCGIATLTHTPSPMKFLNDILDRPVDERPYMILVAGYPTKDVVVPKIEKKSLEDIATFV